jgi:chloramphenicol-sensitive protein RarD
MQLDFYSQFLRLVFRTNIIQLNKYYLSALAAFIIWGFISLLLKPMHIYAAMDILFYRVFIAASIMLFVLLIANPGIRRENIQTFKKLEPNDKKKTLLNTLLGGILLAFNWFFFIYAMNNISIKAASYAYLICPIITTLLAFFILKENLTRQQWMAVFMSFISCCILAFNHLIDLAYSLIVAMSYALYLITQRNNNLLEKFFILSLQMIFAAVLLLLLFPFFSGKVIYDANFYWQVFLLAVIFTILPLWLNLYALKGVNSSSMGILLYINPILNFIVAAIVFNEPTEPTQIMGYSVIFLSIILFNWARLKAMFA